MAHEINSSYDNKKANNKNNKIIINNNSLQINNNSINNNIIKNNKRINKTNIKINLSYNDNETNKEDDNPIKIIKINKNILKKKSKEEKINNEIKIKNFISKSQKIYTSSERHILKENNEIPEI